MRKVSDDGLNRHAYFFDSGLQFECLQCGACCVGDPGTIYVSEEEIDTIAAFLKLDQKNFHHRYLYPFRDSYSIREDNHGRCLFFDNGCMIYQVRPHQCRTFPFWFSNLRSEKRWRKIAGQCPGIGQGRHYSREEILAIVTTTMSV